MFLISLLMVIISSYLILSVIYKKFPEKNFAGFLYFLLIAFSQLVLSFEVLSLFKAISKEGILICNIIFFALSVIFFVKNGNIIYKPDLKEDIKQISFSLKKDKLLLFLSLCFVLFVFFQTVSAAFFPVSFGDSLSYYLTRCTSWIQNGCINHFATPDSRELVMPVNMEFLYTWLLLLRKNETGMAVFSLISYFGAIYVIFNFLKELGYSVRRRLWTIFVFSSFVLVIIEMYTPCADMFIGALMLASLYLYLKAVKTENKWILYFASLSYALAVGTKLTALISIPTAFVVMATVTYLYKKEQFWKYILTFGGFFLLNFFIFASYNYILNLLHYSNPVSCSEQMLLNKFRGGFKGWLCNVIRYFFMMFDISGIKDYIGYNSLITYLYKIVLAILGEKTSSYTSNYFSYKLIFDSSMHIMRSFLGIMGLLAVLPSMIKSVKYAIKNKISKRNIIMASLTVYFILSIFLWSRIMVYTQYNIRYLLTFAVFISPVAAYSYIRKTTVFKALLSFLIFVYFILNTYSMPVKYLSSYFKYLKTRENASVPFLTQNGDIAEMYKYINKNNAKNVGLILKHITTPNYYIEKAKLFGVRVDSLLVENIEACRLENYDYIITDRDETSSTNVIAFEDKMKYPDLFVTKCIYFDYEQAQITDLNTKPAMVQCKIPYEYFAQKGFVLDENINLEKFTILKNINK